MGVTAHADHKNGELGPLDRRASLDYIKPSSKLNRRYVGPGAEFNTGEYESREVIIRDGRNIRDSFSIEKSGFFLAEHCSQVSILQTPALLYLPDGEV